MASAASTVRWFSVTMWWARRRSSSARTTRTVPSTTRLPRATGTSVTRPGDGVPSLFTTSSSGAADTAFGMSTTWGDYDRDGWMDMYVSNMFSSAGNRIAYQRQFRPGSTETLGQYQRHARGNSLFVNGPEGFRDASEEAGVTVGRWAWGSIFVDVNNDGWEDIYVTNGFITADDNNDL